MIAFLSFLSLLALVSATNITISDGEYALSSHTQGMISDIVQIDVKGVGAHAMFLMHKGDVDALYTDTMSIVVVDVGENNKTIHATELDMCIAIFSEAMDEKGLLGCIGNEYACMNNPKQQLRMCGLASTQEGSVVASLRAFDGLIVLMGTTTLTEHKLIKLRIRIKQPNPQADCPIFSMVYSELGSVKVSVSAPLKMDYNFRVGSTTSTVSKGIQEVVIPTSPLGNGKVSFFIFADDLSCFQILEYVINTKYKVADAFDHTFDIFMRKPSKKAVISFNYKQSGLPLGTFLIFTLLNEKGAVVDSKVRECTSVVPVVLDVISCVGVHYVSMTVMYLDGGRILQVNQTFDPGAFCLTEGAPYYCFCGSDQIAPVNSTVLEGFSLYISAATGVETGVVISNVQNNRGMNMFCVAIDLLSGVTSTRRQSISEKSCKMDVHSGVYMIRHGYGYLEMEWKDDIHTYDIVVVCQLQRVTVETIEMSASSGGLLYLHANTGVTCPDIPDYISNNITVYRTDIAVVDIRWYHSVDEDTGEFLFVSAGNVNIWNPVKGHYQVDVIYTYDGKEQLMSTTMFFKPSAVSTSSAPPSCIGVTTLLTYNRIPRMETDHGAFATIAILSQGNTTLRSEWAIQVILTGSGYVHVENWMKIRAGELTPFVKKLTTTTDYAFKLMRIDFYESGLRAHTACYHEVGVIHKVDPVVIRVISPIELVSCGAIPTQALVFFQVYCSDMTVLDVPFSEYPIEFYKKPQQYEQMATFVLGPIDIDVYKPRSLILYFKMGLLGEIVEKTLDTIFTSKLHPPVSAFSVVDLKHQSLHDVFTLPSDQFHCGTDEGEDAHTVTLITANPTSLAQIVTDNHGNKISPTKTFFREGTMTFVFPVKPVQIGHQETAQIYVSLDSGSSDTIVRLHCPVIALEYTIPPYVPLNVDVQLVALNDTPLDYADSICAGRRLFRFTVPGAVRNPISYRTVNDPDLGSVTVYDGAVFPITIDRSFPVKIYTFYNEMQDRMGVKLSCQAELAASNFKATTNPDSSWMVDTINARLASSTKSTCSVFHAGSFDKHIGGFTFTIDYPSYEMPPGLSLVASDGVPVMYRGYPNVPPNSKYVYSGLQTGAYISTVTLMDPIERFLCTRQALFFIETENDDDVKYLVDMEKTNHGVKKMLCPRMMFADAQTWLEYYTIVFRPDIYTKLLAQGVFVDILIWRHGSNKPVSTFRAGPNPTVIYRIPQPGTYVAEIVVSNDKIQAKCSNHLPEYIINEPAFTAESFVIEVMEYPKCGYTSDGLLRISYPSVIISRVEVTLLSCVTYMDRLPCVRQIDIDSSNQGYVFVSGVPFASRLTFRYEIMGACAFNADYVFAPSPNIHPVSIMLKYYPSCQALHQVRAVFADEYSPLTHGNGKSFAWKVENITSADDMLWVNPKTHSQKNITLTITYNGVCTVSSWVVLDSMFISPRISIDKLLYHKTSRSLPVFCPNDNDAVLYADVFPPVVNKSLVQWFMNDAELPREQVLYDNPEVVMAHSLSAGVYRAVYSSYINGVRCSSEDTAIVYQKDRYNLLNTLEISPAPCQGQTASARIVPETENSILQSEISLFSADMFLQSDRKYVADLGHGTDTIKGVPDGHVISLMIPYNSAYRMRKREFCIVPCVIDFRQNALPPIFAIDDSSVFWYVPKWHGNAAIIVSEGKMSVATDMCVTEIPQKPENGWKYSIDPVVQTMSCSYSQPQAVAVSKLFSPTADVFYTKTVKPLGFSSYLKSINPLFDIITPEAPFMQSKTIADILCNKVDTMIINIQFVIPTGIVLQPEKARVGGYVAEATTRVSCGWTNLKEYVVCSISRTDSIIVNIPYISSTGGECIFTVETYDLVALARTYVPVPLITPAGEGKFNVCLDSTDMFCYTMARFGIHTFEGTMKHACQFHYSIAIPDTDMAMARRDEKAADDVVELVQVMHPSCRGGSDGAIIWKFDAKAVAVIPDSAMKVSTETGTTTVILREIKAGTHWLRYRILADPSHMTMYQTVTLIDPRPLSYIIQPSDLPPPQFQSHTSSIYNIPTASGAPVMVTAYLAGESENAIVSIIGVSVTGKRIAPECDVETYSSIYWTHRCEVLLSPGYTYDFSVTCNGDGNSPEGRIVTYQEKARRGENNMFEISNLPELAIRLSIVQPLTSMFSNDGKINLYINGGMPPFTVLPSGMDAIKTSLRLLLLSNRPMGVTEVGVVDALGSVASQMLVMTPHESFEILSVDQGRQSGCGLNTLTEVGIYMTYGSRPTRAGAWNRLRADTEIKSCNDTRMDIAFEVDSRFVRFVVAPGEWYVAVCQDNLLVTTKDQSPVFITAQTSTLSVSKIAVGEVCVSYKTLTGYETQKNPSILISGNSGPVVVAKRYPLALVDRNVRSGVYVFESMPPGFYFFTVFEEDKQCTVDVDIRVIDVGVGICGTCERLKRDACFGCDGVPHSKAVLDNCGVCNGNNACADTCDISSHDSVFALRQLMACSYQGRTTTFRTETELFDVVINVVLPLKIMGPVHFSGASVFSSTEHVDLSHGVILTDSVTIHSPEITLLDINVDGCTLIFSNSTESIHTEGRRRLLGVADDDTVTITTFWDTVVVHIQHARISESSITFNISIVYEVNVTNSSFYHIQIIGDMPTINLTLDYNSTLSTLDVTQTNIPEEVDDEQFVCSLFVSIQTLKHITRGSITYDRNSFSCKGFGSGADLAAEEAKENENRNTLSQAQLVAVVCFSLAFFMVMAFVLMHIPYKK